MFIDVPFLNSTGLAIVAEADLHCGDFFSEKKLSLQIGCFHKLLYLATESVFSFDNHKNTQRQFFLVVKALWACWWFIEY